MSLPERLEQAAEALPGDANAIRPANGDPHQLLAGLEPAAAVRVLAWLFENAPEEAGRLASAWLDEPDGVGAMTAIDEATLPKAGRKVLRRLLHAARSRGLEVGDARSTVTKVARLPDLHEEISAGYVSPLDPRGSRLVYLVESSHTGGARVFEVLIDPNRGIVDFQLYRAGRRQVREFVRDVTGRQGRLAAVEADPSAVRVLIARAVASHPVSQPFPKPFSEWRSRLTKGAEAFVSPGEQVREALGSEASADAIARLAEAVRSREIGPWPPSSDLLETAVADLRGRAEVAGDEAEDALEGWVRESMLEAYAGAQALIYAERFEECAYLYWCRGEEDTARACVATAASLRDEQGASAPAVEALCEVIAGALVQDLRQSLGIGAQEGTENVAAAESDD